MTNLKNVFLASVILVLFIEVDYLSIFNSFSLQ